MVLRIGLDDTDSPQGGCTTWVLTELLDLARERGVDLVGEPRLVRLNPNIPWKTRGNAALSAAFGRGAGTRRRIGVLRGKPLWSHAAARPLPPDDEAEFVEAAWERIRSRSRSEAGTDPAMVAASRRLPADLYWRTVREVVDVEEVRELLSRRGARYFREGSGRGIVGAAAAVAWPGGHPTWELIAYRRAERVGRPRRVDARSVLRAQERFPQLFLCRDPRTRRLLVAPHSPCPILFGLRATEPWASLGARAEVRSEPVDRWVLFRTNQGSGDHLAVLPFRQIGPYRSAIVDGTVAEPPVVGRGGHARLILADSAGDRLDCLAFEPTKVLPAVARQLRPGDRLRVWGSRGATGPFRLEGIRVVRLVPRLGPLRPPDCSRCGRRARSLGTGRGFRCPRCRHRWPVEAGRRSRLDPGVVRGTYHPTASARRHLAPRAPEP